MLVDKQPDVAVPLGTAVLAASFYTHMMDHTPFQNLQREQLSALPYSIIVNTCKTRHLKLPDGSISDEFVHMSQESDVIVPANVSSMLWSSMKCLKCGVCKV